MKRTSVTTTINKECADCSSNFFEYCKTIADIDKKEVTKKGNIQIIQKMWEKNSTFWPRPWESYRSRIKEDIQNLQQENSKINEALVELNGKKKRLDPKIDDCVERGCLVVSANP